MDGERALDVDRVEQLGREEPRPRVISGHHHRHGVAEDRPGSLRWFASTDRAWLRSAA
jgi:hypothetical protein